MGAIGRARGWRLLLVGITTITIVAAAALTGCTASAPSPATAGLDSDSPPPVAAGQLSASYPVVSVADGDTITVSIDGVNERIRLIGIDAPELHNPPECFGRESANYAAEVMNGTSVQLLRDDSQDDRDRYGRLLRYVFLPGNVNVNGAMVSNGFAYEYTYDKPYFYRDPFMSYQDAARSAGTGLWSPSTCGGQRSTGQPTATAPTALTRTTLTPPALTPLSSAAPLDCPIKGNINSKGDKIFHLPGDDSYAATVITPSKGERYFCSIEEAEAAGWRAAKN